MEFFSEEQRSITIKIARKMSSPLTDTQIAESIGCTRSRVVRCRNQFITDRPARAFAQRAEAAARFLSKIDDADTDINLKVKPEFRTCQRYDTRTRTYCGALTHNNYCGACTTSLRAPVPCAGHIERLSML